MAKWTELTEQEQNALLTLLDFGIKLHSLTTVISFVLANTYRQDGADGLMIDGKRLADHVRSSTAFSGLSGPMDVEKLETYIDQVADEVESIFAKAAEIIRRPGSNAKGAPIAP